MRTLFLHGWTSTPGGVKPTHLRKHGHEVLDPALPDDDFDAAVRIAQAEFDQGKPDVVVGSSRGGAVAMNIDSGDTPLVLLCPAWKRWGSAKTVKRNTVILHSPADETIPFADSKELLRNSGLPESALIVVGTDHRLADAETLAKMLEVVERCGDAPRRDTEAHIRMSQLYERLDSLLNRHQPIDYAPFAAATMKRWLAAPDYSEVIALPHRVLHSIEANCRYAQKENSEPVTAISLPQVLNVYAEHEDPLHSGLASQSIDHLFLALHREQIELQHVHARGDLARDLRLFVADNPLPQLSAHFSSQIGLTVEEWFQLSFVTWAAANSHPSGCFTTDTVMSAEVFDVAPEQGEAFFNASSKTPAAIGKRFAELRESLKPQFHSLIRSVFLEAPLIDFGQGRMLAPQPSLVLRHSGQGLYRILRGYPHFDSEFGESFERYVEQVLRSMTGLLRLLDKRHLERLSPGKSCDFLVELPDAVLLVEAKAVTFSAALLTEKAIIGDNSTGKVAKGIEQVYTTAYGLCDGSLAALSVPPTKPILGIVVTYGDLPLANSKWYFENFFLKRAESRLKPPIYPSATMKRLPVILPIHVLELLVTTINHLSVTAMQLCEEKDSQPYLKVGDWNAFLSAKRRASEKTDFQLPFANEQLNQFLESLGCEREQAGEL